MSEAAFPEPVAEIMTTLVGIFRHQERVEIVELLESAHARFDDIDYDGWDGGTTTWALRLEVPVEVFASIEPRLADIEEEIADKLSYLRRLYRNNPLNEVTVSPSASRDLAAKQGMTPSEIEVHRLWPDGRFRLFLGYVSKHKALVSELQTELAPYGVAAFVAHEDIGASLEWQKEIELALRSMHALAALITKGFHESDWTDQEIGWAFGKGALVLPVRLEADPYGFAGKVQGVSGSLDKPAELAEAIVETLLFNEQTHSKMKHALVRAFAASDCWATAKILKELVLSVSDFTDDEKAALLKACEDNSQVGGAWGVQDTIRQAFGQPKSAKRTEYDIDIPF